MARRRAAATLMVCLLAGCQNASSRDDAAPVRPTDVPALHHVGLNTVDADSAMAWYLRLWPTAKRGTFANRPSVDAEMALVFHEVASPPTGAFEESLGRPREQSPFWHIGAFANTTGMDERLAGIGVHHLPLHTGAGDDTVWRSGLSPFNGIVTRNDLTDAQRVAPRPGGFSYVVGPDGALFELTGGPRTEASLSHIHFFHEQPRCAANWYVEQLGMDLPPARGADGATSPRELYAPCEGSGGEPGWPSLERQGTIRQPRATVVYGNGSMSFYPRQCTSERCGSPQPLVPSRGQVLDHVGFSVDDLQGWRAWLMSRGVVILEEIHDIDEGRAFMFEGPDRLAIEFVQTRE